MEHINTCKRDERLEATHQPTSKKKGVERGGVRGGYLGYYLGPAS